MRNAFVSGTGFYVPPSVVTNQDLADRYGIEISHEWLVKRTGIECRRFAEEGIGSSELAEPAARMAIESAGLRPEDLEMILFATLSPRHAFPGGGVYLQHELGIPGVPAMDIRNQCSGFVYGLTTAKSMVRSGVFDHVLLVGAECHSAALNLSTSGGAVSGLFGDGAGAVVVSATDDDRGIRTCRLGADGRHADALAQKIWDVRKRPFIDVDAEGNGMLPAEDLWARMDGRLVFKNAIERMCSVLLQACREEKSTPSDLDLVFFHQANMRINQHVQRQLGLPDEKVPCNIQRYGNTTAATIPIMLAEAVRDGTLRRGMKIACVAFGSGFTWGACVIDW